MPTSPWSVDELDAIGCAVELEVSSRRPDGTLPRLVPVWVVRVGDEVFVRSALGGAKWFHRAKQTGMGRVRAGLLERDVAFVALEPGAAEHGDIDAAYWQKYGNGAGMIGPGLRDATLRLDPR